MRKLSQREKIRQVVALGFTPKQARLLVVLRNTSPERIRRRLAQLREANAPSTGFIGEIGRHHRSFTAYVDRFRVHGGLTVEQRRIKALLDARHISEGVVQSIVGKPSGKGRRTTLKALKDKISFLESIKLDREVYGVERIPPAFYEKVLRRELNAIKRGIKRKVLWPLQVNFAEKELDRLLPKWRESKTLVKIGAVRALRNLREIIDAGRTPSMREIADSSIETIRNSSGGPKRKWKRAGGFFAKNQNGFSSYQGALRDFCTRRELDSARVERIALSYFSLHGSKVPDQRKMEQLAHQMAAHSNEPYANIYNTLSWIASNWQVIRPRFIPAGN